jgi:hypothetical protein
MMWREEDGEMRLSSSFLNKRDISQISKPELEDLHYHLENRKRSLQEKIAQMERDLSDLLADQQMIEREMRSRHS